MITKAEIYIRLQRSFEAIKKTDAELTLEEQASLAPAYSEVRYVLQELSSELKDGKFGIYVKGVTEV